MKKHEPRCDGRRGVLQVSEDGKWRSICFEDDKHKRPKIFDCRHHAEVALLEIVMPHILLGTLPLLDIIEGQTVRFTYVDEVPKDFDPAVADTTQAADVLRSIFNKGAAG